MISRRSVSGCSPGSVFGLRSQIRARTALCHWVEPERPVSVLMPVRLGCAMRLTAPLAAAASPTSRFYETNPFNFNGIGLLLVTIGRAPCALRFDHGIGDPADAVEVGDVRIREGGFSDSQGLAVARGQDDGADLMRLESVARRCP